MNDSDFINIIAREWIRLGGDSEGVAWSWMDLKNRVLELERPDIVVEGILEDNEDLLGASE